MLPKPFYRFTVIPVTIPRTFLDLEKQKNVKLTWEHKKPQIAKMVLKNKTKAGGITI